MLFSLASWKKSAKSVDGVDTPAGGGSHSAGGMRSKAMILIAVLGVGALGYKMFWPDSEPVKAAAAMPKMTAPAKQGMSAAVKPGTKATPRVKDNARTNAAATADGNPARATPAANAAPRTRAKAAPADDDTDIPTREEIAKPPPKSNPTATKSPTASAAASASNEILAPAFVDENNGFTIRFPGAWAIRTFASEPWVLDCGDGRTALISIGFSAFPADFTADNIPPEWVARRIKKRSDTTLHSQGYALIGGKKALWSKSTGPLPMTNGNPRMTRVNYIVPLHDGRVMELRIATTPEIFDQLMPTMRQSVESFKFIPRAASAQH
jgi:hypothetical protein